MWMSVENQRSRRASSSALILWALIAAPATRDTSWWAIAASVSDTIIYYVYLCNLSEHAFYK